MKGCGFWCFAKTMGTYATKVAKNSSNRYSQKLLDTAKKFTADASKRAIQKTAEATGDLIGNKIADKIASVSKKSPKELLSQNEDKIEIPKKDI